MGILVDDCILGLQEHNVSKLRNTQWLEANLHSICQPVPDPTYLHWSHIGVLESVLITPKAGHLTANCYLQ